MIKVSGAPKISLFAREDYFAVCEWVLKEARIKALEGKAPNLLTLEPFQPSAVALAFFTFALFGQAKLILARPKPVRAKSSPASRQAGGGKGKLKEVGGSCAEAQALPEQAVWSGAFMSHSFFFLTLPHAVWCVGV